MNPIIIINFKAYESAIGKNAVVLAKAAEMVAKETGANITVAVQAADIFRVREATKVPIFAQHVDAVEFGAFTGAVLAEGAKAAGATGSLVNHAEKRIDIEAIGKTVARLKSLGMSSVVCAESPEKAEKIARFSPDYIAYEPPELIGGEISVSTASPHIIKDAVQKVKAISPKTKVLAGAGVKEKKDIDVASSLGASGVIVASHVAKASDQKKAIMGLV